MHSRLLVSRKRGLFLFGVEILMCLNAAPVDAQRLGISSDRTREVITYGKQEALPRVVRLRAGPLSMEYESGDLRYIKLRDREVVRRLYAATRDRNWGTLPTELTNEKIDVQEDSFQITYDVRNKQNDIDFAWRGTIEGDKQGRIKFSMQGVAQSTFLRNRIGFCVLHPSRECPGSRCRVETADGRIVEGEFPRFISPQAPFPEMKGIAHEVVPGVWCKLEFTGDTFEMEDQRNWVDASFKTFCTPLRLPYPVEVKQGTKIEQSVTLSLEGPVAASEAAKESDRVVIEIIPNLRRLLPQIGLGAASHGGALSALEKNRLQALSLSHIRLDLKLSDTTYPQQLRQVSGEARDFGVPLEAALFLTADAENELQSLAKLLEDVKPAVRRWLVFHNSEKSTTQKWVALAREHLRRYDSNARVFSGTNAYFTELNRERPPTQVSEGVVYSLNPQVHAFDNRSLVETLEVHPATVESARQFSSGLPIAISPITLLPRFNPNATGVLKEPPSDALPAQVDVRQMSLFGAGWTLGSLKYLAESAVESVTFFETTGWRGVMETEAGNALPTKFRSLPGEVFPIYHVLADVGEFRGGDVVVTRSSDSLRVESLLLAKGSKRRMLLVNLTGAPQTARVAGLSADMRIRRLNVESAPAAMLRPEEFRGSEGAKITDVPQGEIRLASFEVVSISQ